MDWFRAYHEIISDPKWPIIARKSGQCVGTVVAVWMALLTHASQSADRGHILGFDPEAVDALYGYDDGVTTSIIDALKSKGMIVDDWIVNWAKRQPERERNDVGSAERVRNFRERQKLQSQPNQHDTSITPHSVTPCNASVTPCNASVTPCNASVTPQIREEENREEQRKEETTNVVSCAETSESARSTPEAPQENSSPEKISDEPSEPDDPITCIFPCDGKKPFYQVCESYIARMQTLYHGIDIREETLKALAWVENNPSRRKTYDGMTRFLGNWYGKAQNNGGARASPQIRAPAKKPSPLAYVNSIIAGENPDETNKQPTASG